MTTSNLQDILKSVSAKSLDDKLFRCHPAIKIHKCLSAHDESEKIKIKQTTPWTNIIDCVTL